MVFNVLGFQLLYKINYESVVLSNRGVVINEKTRCGDASHLLLENVRHSPCIKNQHHINNMQSNVFLTTNLSKLILVIPLPVAPVTTLRLCARDEGVPPGTGWALGPCDQCLLLSVARGVRGRVHVDVERVARGLVLAVFADRGVRRRFNIYRCGCTSVAYLGRAHSLRVR